MFHNKTVGMNLEVLQFLGDWQFVVSDYFLLHHLIFLILFSFIILSFFLCFIVILF